MALEGLATALADADRQDRGYAVAPLSRFVQPQPADEALAALATAEGAANDAGKEGVSGSLTLKGGRPLSYVALPRQTWTHLPSGDERSCAAPDLPLERIDRP